MEVVSYPVSDSELVRRLRAGDADAFRAIDDRYREPLRAFARHLLGCNADEEDVVQDVLARAHLALTGSAAPIALRPWLYRAARHRCIDILRRTRRRDPRRLAPLLVDPPDPSAELERRERLHEVVAAIGSLPERQRSALTLHAFGGVGLANIADSLETTVPGVKGLLTRARAGLLIPCRCAEQ